MACTVLLCTLRVLHGKTVFALVVVPFRDIEPYIHVHRVHVGSGWKHDRLVDIPGLVQVSEELVRKHQPLCRLLRCTVFACVLFHHLRLRLLNTRHISLRIRLYFRPICLFLRRTFLRLSHTRRLSLRAQTARALTPLRVQSIGGLTLLRVQTIGGLTLLTTIMNLCICRNGCRYQHQPQEKNRELCPHSISLFRNPLQRYNFILK